MNVATRPSKEEKLADPRLKSRVRLRLAAGCVGAKSLCETIQDFTTKAGGLAALQALFPDGSDAADLVVAYNAARTFAVTLNPALTIPDLI